MNTQYEIYELESTQLNLLTMSVWYPQPAGYLLTGNRRNFLQVEDSFAWLFDYP